MARLAPPALGAAGTRASAAGSWHKTTPKPLPQSVVLEAKKLYTEQQGGPPPSDREALEVLRANLPTPPLPKAIVDAARSLYAARVGGAPPDDTVAIELRRATLPGHAPVRLQPPSLGSERAEAAPRQRRRVGAAVCARAAPRAGEAAASVALAARRRGAHGASEAGARRPVGSGRAGRRHLFEQVWVAALCH